MAEGPGAEPPGAGAAPAEDVACGEILEQVSAGPGPLEEPGL